MSAPVRCRSVVFHRVHAHWPHIPTALDCRSSSSVSFISCCTIWLLSLLLEQVQRCGFVLPRQCLPTAVVPTMYLCRSLLSAWKTAWLADHFPLSSCVRLDSRLPYQVICWLFQGYNQSSFDSSTIEVIGSFSWLVLPYSSILVKLGGTPSHLRRCRLISRSNP